LFQFKGSAVYPTALYIWRHDLARLIAMPGADARTRLRARVLHGAATQVHGSSDFHGACLLAKESLAIARELGDRALVARVLSRRSLRRTRKCEEVAGNRPRIADSDGCGGSPVRS
jgi:hypothetical protein